MVIGYQKKNEIFLVVCNEHLSKLSQHAFPIPSSKFWPISKTIHFELRSIIITDTVR